VPERWEDDGSEDDRSWDDDEERESFWADRDFR
jgi:hypothetical protein